MNDAPFSSNFVMFDPEGISHQFTVRAEDADQHLSALAGYKARLAAAGFSAQRREPGQGEKVVDAAYVVRGTYQEKKSGDFKPCLHFYGERGEYRQFTVYPESFDILPAGITKVLSENAKAKVFDTAPERERAAAAKALIVLPKTYQARLAPMVDQDGKPLVTEKGNIRYKFGGSWVNAEAPDKRLNTIPDDTAF